MEHINLNQSYEEFIAHYKVYETYTEAEKYKPSKGYEIHHIVPKATQEGYVKRKKPQDDRCIILTVFNHVLAHYLYCRDYPEEKSQFIALDNMCYEHAKELLEDEKKFIEELPYIAEMRAVIRTPWNKGKTMSEEFRKKCSKSNKGRTSPRKGKHHTEEAKRKMSESHKGKTAHNKGIPMSEEQKKKLSEIRKGMNAGEKSPSAKKVFQRDLDGNILNVFPTIREASIQLGKNVNTISAHLNGRYLINDLNFTLSFN